MFALVRKVSQPCWNFGHHFFVLNRDNVDCCSHCTAARLRLTVLAQSHYYSLLLLGLVELRQQQYKWGAPAAGGAPRKLTDLTLLSQVHNYHWTLAWLFMIQLISSICPDSILIFDYFRSIIPQSAVRVKVKYISNQRRISWYYSNICEWYFIF